MDLIPIVRALSRRKTGAILIALQVALSVAILSNCIAVVQQRLAHMRRSSGMDEANIVTMANQFAGTTEDLASRIQADLAQLRAIPGVVDAVAGQSFPLRGYGRSTGVWRASDAKATTLNVADYAFSERTLDSWGLKLIAGRNFTHAEIREFQLGSKWLTSPVAIVTQALARTLFPRGDALGHDVYLNRRLTRRNMPFSSPRSGWPRTLRMWCAHSRAGAPPC
jgi:putative ABC transport system permease protein